VPTPGRRRCAGYPPAMSADKGMPALVVGVLLFLLAIGLLTLTDHNGWGVVLLAASVGTFITVAGERLRP
jgi:hypothetical protein